VRNIPFYSSCSQSGGKPTSSARTTPIENSPERLTDVLTNIINELEQRQQTPRDDYVIQAFLALQAMADLEHERRKMSDLAIDAGRRRIGALEAELAQPSGPRIGG
jgi:hypothetical protein